MRWEHRCKEDLDKSDMDEFAKEWRLRQTDGLKNSDLRQEYERKVNDLRELPPKLMAEGKTEEEIARIMHQTRRELVHQYKLAAPPLFREYIYAATAKKYGDPLGPTFEMLCKTKSYRQIIESASRPIENLDNRLTVEGFRDWYQRK